jgi:ATP/maltotriose-dependent transcriptional regulator MalT
LNQGKFADALGSAQQALALFEEEGAGGLAASFGHDPVVSSHYWAGHALWFLGYPDQALDLALKAREIATATRHLTSLAWAELRAARISQFRGEVERTREHAAVALELAEMQGLPYQRALAFTLLGWADAHGRAVGGAVDRIRRGLDCQVEIGAVMERPYDLGLLADALLQTGRVEEGRAAVEEALSTIAQGARAFFWEAELHRLGAELLLREGEVAAADGTLREALAIASRQGARSLQLRVALSFFRLYGRRAGREEARELLASVVASFTEGSGTPDHCEAAAILEASP